MLNVTIAFKVVFPALRERLEKHRISLIDIELRWGVTQAEAATRAAVQVDQHQLLALSQSQVVFRREVPSCLR